ncbi:MAG: cyclase family protein [Planctomycetota bacterium]|nr:cyclase family protein [Planctomycetota bacterium]
MKIHDISLPIHPAMLVWRGDGQPRFPRTGDLAEGDDATVTAITFSAHTGTHVDAPNRFVAGAPGVETLDLNVLIGPAAVVDTGDAPVITAEVLAALPIPAGIARVLFRTANTRADALHKPFRDDYVGLSLSGAQWLLDRGVRLIGVDYLSVGSREENVATHNLLLGARVVLLETLDLSAVAPGVYQLIALPLRLVGLDGAPTRAVLIEPE